MSKKIRTPNNFQPIATNGMEGKKLVPVEGTNSLRIVEQDPIVSMIERAAHSPEVSVEKLNALFDLRLRMMEKNDEMEFNSAMNRVQSKLRKVAPNLFNNQTKSKYASYDAMDSVVRPVYSAEGIALSFNSIDSPLPDHVRVLAYVTRGAYTRTYQLDMPNDGKGAKGGDVMTKTHAQGAAMSYGMRNLLKYIFAIAIGEEDADGNTAECISSEQADEMRALIAKYGDGAEEIERRMLTHFKFDNIESIPAKDYNRVMTSFKSVPK